MKKLISMAFMLSSFVTFGQSPVENQPLVITRVIPVKGLTKEVLYQKSLLWCKESFRNNAHAIDIAEKESGLIAGKGHIDLDIDRSKNVEPAACTFNWKIETTDGRASFLITDIRYELNAKSDYQLTSSRQLPFDKPGLSARKKAKYWKDVKRAATRAFNDIIDTYAKALKQG